MEADTLGSSRQSDGSQSVAKHGLTTTEAQQRLQQHGFNELTEYRVSALRKILGYFWGPIPWMIEVAAILSWFVHHYAELWIILVLLAVNAVVGFWEEHQAGNAIAQLKRGLALKARALRDGSWVTIDARELVPGDVARVRLGDVVPADLELLQGDYLSVDQSGLTGESLPVTRKVGESVYSGSVVKQGEMDGQVVATGMQTYMGKTAKLVGAAKKVSHFQQAVLTIGRYLIYITLALVALVLAVGVARHAPTLELVQFALILVVAAIPVAMPAVLSVTMAIGAMGLAKMKAIVARLESIEEMAGVDVLCSDKTGTLTENRLTLGEPVVFGKTTVPELIRCAALASEEERDPIDAAVMVGAKDDAALGSYVTQKFVPFDPVRKRSEAIVRDGQGGTLHVTKGAPQVILSISQHDAELERAAADHVEELARRGYRTLGVARSDDGETWTMLGLLPLYDPPRADAAETIAQAGAHGLHVKMITGDHVAIAKETARALGLGRNISEASAALGDDGKPVEDERRSALVERADGFAQVFPEHKYSIIRALQARGHLVGMTGDGVNDAPALKQADVGIAVSGATDAARASADLVLSSPGLSVIIRAVEEARRIFERMSSYAVYRITETIRILLFMVLAILVYNVYPITAVMVILLALLNDLPIMTIAYDNTWLAPKPVRWAMPRVLTVASVLGLIGVVETFGLFVWARSWAHLPLGQLQSLIFLKLVVAGHLTLFVARTRKSMVSRPRPAWILVGAILATQAVAAAVVGFGWFVTPIPWSYVGLVWAYCLVWVVIEDVAKVLVYRLMSSEPWRRHTSLTGPGRQNLEPAEATVR